MQLAMQIGKSIHTCVFRKRKLGIFMTRGREVLIL